MATVVVIAKAERDGYGSGRNFRGAVFDHSLQVALFCTLHGMMTMLPYSTAPVGGFRVRHLQLVVGVMKGHIIATDLRHTRLVQQTRTHAPAMGIVTQWAIRLQTSDFYGPSPPTPNPPSPP